MKKLVHKYQLNILLSNNYAHYLYLSKKLRYEDIVPFVMNKSLNFKFRNKDIPFRSFKEIINHINLFKKYLNNE